MRLLSGNPGMYQHSVEHTTEGETTQHEPEHGEDTIARVKGTEATPENAEKLIRKHNLVWSLLLDSVASPENAL